MFRQAISRLDDSKLAGCIPHWNGNPAEPGKSKAGLDISTAMSDRAG